MGAGFKLEIPRFRVVAEVVPQSPLNVYGMCVVALDQIRVVAVHGADEIGEGGNHAVRHAAPETG